jgi:hypothetical protein
MITISEVIADAAAAIQANSALATWISTNFPGESLRIQIGEDAAAPLGEEHAPFVVLLPAMQPYDVGTAVQERRPSFDVEWGVVSNASTTAPATGIITYTGHTLRDEMGMKLYDVLIAQFGENLGNVSYQLMGAAPLWEGGMTVTLQYWPGIKTEPTA